MKPLKYIVILALSLSVVLAQSSATAEANAVQSQQAIQLCKKLVFGWLGNADPKTGLLPRRVNTEADWHWNAKDCAADNLPFLLLTGFVTDDYHIKRQTLAILEQEQKLTNRLDRLPDDYLFATQSFRPGPFKLSDIIFGASEYAKDGLTPITEWLGPGPWLGRMTGLMEDIWKHAPIETESGMLPSDNVEVNGEMLQVCSRLYWLTGDDRYRQWVFRLADHYFLHNDILQLDRLRLDDHACEIVGGLSEGYVIASKTDEERWRKYKAHMHRILDRILEVGRNEDGLLYDTVNPKTGEILNKDFTDNWGYDYNAFLTVAEIDNAPQYREAVEHVLNNIHKYLDFKWERGGADGYADSIEGGINLLNRVPVTSAFQWVDDSMQILLAKQGDDGIIEGWYGDGNTARTSLMYALWKTQGISASPWRYDVELGATANGNGGVEVYLKAGRPWNGKLRFDRPRHRDYFQMPLDYARINQFPEWFTVEQDRDYRVEADGESRIVRGEQLFGYRLSLAPGKSLRLSVTPR